MRFHLLGPLEVIIEGVTVPLARPRRRAVLAYLLLSPNHPVSMERLIDAIWGGTPPPTARDQVHADISAIRRTFRAADVADPILTSQAGYKLRILPGQLDTDDLAGALSLARAEAIAGRLTEAVAVLAGALGLWRGTPLADVSASYVDAARARLTEQRLDIEERLAELRLALGDNGAVIHSMRAMVDDHPLREHTRVLMMLALYRTGRRSGALQVARDLRRILADEEGLDPGPEVADLETRILRDDPSLLQDRPSYALGRIESPQRIRPAQLPGPVSDFVGRDGCVRRLEAAADHAVDTGGTVVAVTGLAGVGKTSLVLHWAYQSRHRFPDGQLFADMHGYARMAPVRPIEAISRFLRALGVPPDKVPTNADEATALYRTILANRRVLIVLDNARGANQIRPLLTSNRGCLVVVTSRDTLVGLTARESATHIALPPLTPGQAHRLLVRMLGHDRVAAEGAAVADLAAACGHLPLALRVAAAILNARPTDGLSRYAADLRHGAGLSALELADDPDATIRVAFDHSYRSLSAEASRLFGRLGATPGCTFTPASAAALAGISPRKATQLLNQIADASLIERCGPSRFAFHQLVRVYAAERAGSDKRAELRPAGRRLRRHLSTVNQAAPLLEPADPVRVSAAAPAWPWLYAEQTGPLATTGTDLSASAHVASTAENDALARPV